MTKPSSRFARSLQHVAVLALIACPALALAQELPPGHPPVSQPADAQGSEAKPADTKPADAKQAEAKQAEAKQAEAKLPSSLLPPTSTTHDSITIAGENLSYTAEAGTIPLPGADGKPAAEIFYVAYTRDPLNTKRPITFVFNGGPGAAAAYLHLGGIGPRAVATTDKGELIGPPPRLVDNPSTWLDMTDLVFVDPVGTGYSRASETKDEEKFWGVVQDTDALTDFVRLYLVKQARMLSPVFLMGESYGGFRAASLARALQKSGANSPSGIVMISPVLEFSLLNGEDYDPLSWALGLPSLAAVNLESKGVTGREALGTALKEAEHYALSDYLVELASGAEAGGKAASGTVARLTGLPEEVVERHQARIPPSLFIKEFDRTDAQVLSRYDGSVSGPDPNPASSWPNGPDPVLDATVPLWTAAFVQYAGSELGYKTDAAYRLLNRDARNKWDFGTSPTHQGYAGIIDEVQEARAANPSLQVLIASGYTDLITPYLATTFLVGQLPALPRATPIRIETYAGGHMLYLRPESREGLKQDVKGMYERALKAASWPEG
ncbi:MAG: peptidase S10 [Methyloceanibacter sp.]